MKQYAREFLLSFAEKQNCRRLPGDLDPALSRDNPSPEIVDGGKSASRREQQEVPDWRSRNSTNGGGGLLSHQSRRKSHEEEGYVPRGPSSWGGEGNNVRNKPGPQGPVQTRWDQRSDRDRDKSSRGPQTEGPEQGDSGSRPRFAWNGSEHDGLLGSGGGLRGAYPGGRAPDRYNNVGGRGTRNNDPRSNKPSAGYRNEADTLDGETFGDKISTKDRAEEERRRREEFEAMRKEQHGNKEQKKPEKVDDGASVDDNSPTRAVSEPKPDVSTPPAIISTPRPLVPPGFSQTSLQKLVKNDIKEEVVEEHSECSSNPQRILQSVDATVAEGDLFALEDNFRVNAIDKLFSKASSSSALLSSSHKSEKLETRTSKFAHLFSVDDESSILSLLSSPPAASKQRAGNSPRSPVSTTSEVKPSSEGGHMLPMPVAPSLEDVEKGLGREAEKNFNATSTLSSSQQLGKPFLTCEDIEQSLLAEVKYDNQATEYSSWKKEPDADSNASRHLLSLLQKPSSNEPVKATEQVNEGQRGSDTGVPTLESLFGTSFMMELRSKDAPLSAKAVSDTSNSMLQLPTKNDAPASAVDFQARMLNESGPKVVDGHPGHHRWASLWSGKPEKPRDRLASQLMSFDEIRNNASATEVEKNYQEFNRDTLGFYQENGESARLTDPSSYVSYTSEAGTDSPARNQPREELNSGVLNDFLKFKKAMKHRNKVNDSFLGMIDGGNEAPSATERPDAETAAPAALYRSHSPPQINQRSSAQLQQLKHALATQGSKLAAAKQQFQQNVLMGNGDLSGRDENRYGRGFSRQQQLQLQQAMFEQQVHGGHLVAPQGFPPPAMYNKQRPHTPAGYFPPNGSNQALHLAGVPPAHIPAMNYGHHHHHPHPGFSGGFAVPNEVFMAGEHPASAAENRWSGREQPPSEPPPHVAGVSGLYQQQPMYGMNKLGYP